MSHWVCKSNQRSSLRNDDECFGCFQRHHPWTLRHNPGSGIMPPATNAATLETNLRPASRIPRAPSLTMLIGAPSPRRQTSPSHSRQLSALFVLRGSRRNSTHCPLRTTPEAVSTPPWVRPVRRIGSNTASRNKCSWANPLRTQVGNASKSVHGVSVMSLTCNLVNTRLPVASAKASSIVRVEDRRGTHLGHHAQGPVL